MLPEKLQEQISDPRQEMHNFLQGKKHVNDYLFCLQAV